MDNITSTLYFAATSISVFYLALLLICRIQLQAFPRILHSFVVLQCLNMLLSFLLHNKNLQATNLFLYLVSVTAFCSAPLAFLYVCRVFQAETAPARRQLLSLWLMAGIAALLCLPLLISVIPSGIGWAITLRTSGLFWDMYYTCTTLAGLLYVTQVARGLWLAYRIVRPVSVSGILPGTNDPPVLTAAKSALLLVALQWLMNTARVLHCRLYGEPDLASLSLGLVDVSATMMTLLALLLLMIGMAVNRQSTADDARDTSKKYQRSALSLGERTRIRGALASALDNTALLYDPGLTLQKLSRHLGVRAHYLSQVLNQDLQLGFFDLINAARARSAASLLLTEPDTPIVEIYNAVGFNAKSTFYKAFNRELGMSPSAYRKLAKASLA